MQILHKIYVFIFTVEHLFCLKSALELKLSSFMSASVKEHTVVGGSLMHMHRSSASIVVFLPGQVPSSSIRLSDEASLMLLYLEAEAYSKHLWQPIMS